VVTDRHTEKNDYRNPAAHLPRVNEQVDTADKEINDLLVIII
jgi:hypothetical protein